MKKSRFIVKSSDLVFTRQPDPKPVPASKPNGENK